MTDATPGIAAHIEAVRRRIAQACARSGRDPSEITLIAVSKTFPASSVRAAFDAGLADFGENRVQEAVAKITQFAAADVRPRWHFIGHLQSNKLGVAIAHFDTLHSIDSIHLIEAIGQRRGEQTKVDVFLQVNVSGEASKSGVRPADLPALVERARHAEGVILHGLMTIAPHVDDPEAARPVFRELRALAAEHGLRGLSMGMSGDFEVAIEEGATHVRIGQAIFGGRP